MGLHPPSEGWPYLLGERLGCEESVTRHRAVAL